MELKKGDKYFPPGRELDVLIARHVTKLPVDQILNEPGWEGLNTLYARVMIPEYSTRIWAAFEIVNIIGGSFRLSNKNGSTKYWWAYLNTGTAQGDSPEHAICLAALREVGIL